MNEHTARTACVWCPDWPVIASRHRDPELRGEPVVVLERAGSSVIVRAASGEARATGVTRGMRRREAEACCPELVAVDVDEALEARVFERVARAVEALTPRVVLDRPGRCAFLTRGPSRYFGGDLALAVRVRGLVAAVLAEDAEVCVGIADGAFSAQLAARYARRHASADAAGVSGHASADAVHVVAPGESAAFLAPWPVSVVGDADRASLFVRLGLHALGDVAALPIDAVVARFGAEGQWFHELAQGIDPGPPVLVAPPPDLVEQVELDPPAARVDMVTFAAKGLADRLLERLAERGLACTRVMVEAETEHGERLSRCWRHDGVLTPAALAERVRWQLDGWLAATARTGSSGPVEDFDVVDDTTGGLTLLRLVPDEVVPADGRQLGFWGGDQAAHDRADRALARVQGMVGYDAVVTAVVQGGRTAAEQVRWVPWGEPRTPERPLVVDTEVPAWPGALPAPFPARVLEPPAVAQLLDIDAHPVTVTGRGEQSAPPARLQSTALPGGGGAVLGWVGPWACDSRWWDARVRDRRARWQVVVDCGAAGEVACVVMVAAGVAGVEAIHD